MYPSLLPILILTLLMSDTSSIIAELEALQQYETYEPIVRHLEGENLQTQDEHCLNVCPVSAYALYVWDFGA